MNLINEITNYLLLLHDLNNCVILQSEHTCSGSNNDLLLLLPQHIPHLDALDLEGAALFRPGGIPLPLIVVELRRGPLGHIGPGLASHAVLEVPGSATDGQVQDQVELGVEGGALVGGVLPGVVPVGDVGALPVALVGVVDD